MKISLVMTTYNGEKLVERQLNSLYHQERQADEVIIFDDCSSDNTASVISDYLSRNRLDRWKLTQNVQNKGWKKNFIEGLAQACGGLLFPCDQDDVWHPDKLAEMEAVMESNPKINLLACDFDIQYEQGAVRSKHYQGKESRTKGEIVPFQFTEHFFMCPRPGCTFAIRKSFFDRVVPFWFEQAPHDEFLWLCALLSDSAYLYNRPLVTSIRHADNASDIRYKDIAMQLQNLDYIGKSLDVFLKMAEKQIIPVSPEKQTALRQAKIWCAKRKKLMKTRNPLLWLALAPWWGYYNSPQNCLSDLWLVVFGRFRR